jgi:anti-sigma factor RsiW
MDCAGLRPLLHGYLDGELSAADRTVCEEHLLVCLDCRGELEALRALSAALGDAALRHRPPPHLADRLEAALRTADEAPRRRWLRPVTWAAAAALLLAVGLAAWAVLRQPSDADDRLSREVVAAHARSLQEKHLLDVQSSNRHEVKPWFQQGRLDFAPPVKDLSAHGFELAGGRLDYLDDRPVAALVYRRRGHVINLFIWPAAGNGDAAVRTTSRRGYQLAVWTKDGFNCRAVSDLNGEELAEFARLFREGR